MVSNLTGNLHDKVIETDKYLTSKCCSNCKNIKDDLGGSKIYNCYKCNIILDRDINASINIYKNRILIL